MTFVQYIIMFAQVRLYSLHNGLGLQEKNTMQTLTLTSSYTHMYTRYVTKWKEWKVQRITFTPSDLWTLLKRRPSLCLFQFSLVRSKSFHAVILSRWCHITLGRRKFPFSFFTLRSYVTLLVLWQLLTGLWARMEGKWDVCGLSNRHECAQNKSSARMCRFIGSLQAANQSPASWVKREHLRGKFSPQRSFLQLYALDSGNNYLFKYTKC